MVGIPPDPAKMAAYLASIVESSSDAIISKNLSGIVETWNKSAERIFGYTEKEAVGRPILFIIPEELRNEEEYILNRLRQGERIESFETVRRRKDGRLVDISLTVSPIRDEAGTIIGASKIARDITETKRAQRAISETQNRLAVMLGSIADGVVAMDMEGRVTYINPVAEGLLGCSQSDVMGRPLAEVFRPVNEKTRQPAESTAERCLQGGSIVTLANPMLLVRRDGTEIPIDDTASPIRDADGRMVGVVLVIRDVTLRRQTARLAALLSAIVSSSDDAIISKDFSGTITSWNAGAERIFGYTADEMLGQSIRILIPPDRQHEEADILARLSRGQRIDHYETVRRKKNGQLCDISLTISPIRDEDGRLLGASKIARDITEEKRAQRTLYETQERWRVTLESIGDGVIATDPKGLVMFANSVAVNLTGRTNASMMGQPFVDVFPIVNETTRKGVANPIERVIREGVIVGLANHTLLLRPDGTEIPILDSAAPINDAKGKLLGVVVVFRTSSPTTSG